MSRVNKALNVSTRTSNLAKISDIYLEVYSLVEKACYFDNLNRNKHSQGSHYYQRLVSFVVVYGIYQSKEKTITIQKNLTQNIQNHNKKIMLLYDVFRL